MSSEIIELKEFEADLLKTQELLEKHIEVANGQIKESGEQTVEVKSAVEKLSEQVIVMTERCSDMEQKLADASHTQKSNTFDLGKHVADSEAFKAFQDGAREKARIDVKAAIINATGQNQPLVPADRLGGIIHEPNRVLRMRDVMAVGRTESNLIEYAKENVFTNSAGPQVGGSPEAFENVTKPESAITFTLATAAVTTLSHWIPVSKQVISDSPMLQSYINSRLTYGLKLKEDTQILLGTGSNGELPGVYTNRTAYTMDSPLSYTTKLDVLRDAIAQCHASEYMPNAIVLNSADWSDIELSKDTQGRYLFANPQSAAAPALWGLPVVMTNSLTSGVFLVGAFDMACQLWDREDASVEIGLNSDNFVKNMVTILAEERLALTIYRAAGLVGGSFSVA